MSSVIRTIGLWGLCLLLAPSFVLGAPTLERDGEPLLQGSCVPSATVMCLVSNRFSVEIAWEDPSANTGAGQVGSQLFDDTGYFYFADPEQPELFLKILDGTPINTFWWVFFGGLSNWEYTLTVIDTVTAEQAVYFNPLGSFTTEADTSALPGSAARGESRSPVGPTVPVPTAESGDPAPCVPGSTTLCLDRQRFSVEVDWEDFNGTTGEGMSTPVTDLGGYFTFFSADNVELMVKIIDGGDGNFWFYSCAPTDVFYAVAVTDICTGTTQAYFSPLGTQTCFADFMAFPESPNCTPIFTDGFESGDTTAWD